MHDRKQSSEGCRRQTVLQWLAASMIVVAFSGPALADKGDTIELYRLQHKSWELLHHGGMDELIREGQDNHNAWEKKFYQEAEALRNS